MEKLNIKTDVLMLMAYKKKLVKFVVRFRAGAGKWEMEYIIFGIF